MESMTGYAHSEGKAPQFSFAVEIRSLNSKYQEVFINFPKSLSSEEQEIGELIKKSFPRGKIEVSLDLYDWIVSREVSINEDALARYYKGINAFRKKMKAKESFSLDTLLTLDGVVQKGRNGINDASLAVIKKGIESAVKKTLAMRKAEGKALEKDLLTSVATIENNLAEIKKLTAFSSQERFEILKERIEKLMQSSADSARLYTEVAMYADKIDINEEISRLTDHIRKFRETAKESGQIGKKLDFVAQEMFREANTIASKSVSTEVSHLSVEIKNCIEKIREQCRNVV
jgi:uncharacterized protein (TIGR00255 family)